MIESAVSAPTTTLAVYLASAATTELPDAVAARACLHVLDTVAAMVSGSRMPAGHQGLATARALGGSPASTVIGADLLVDPITAALANGMSAHADETDDSHPASTTHPGAAIVPAALAVGQLVHATGDQLVRAVAAGYDVGTRVVLALQLPEFRSEVSSFSSHALAGVFGAAAAGAVLFGMDERAVRHTLSYAAQSASGLTTWLRDTEHIEKAFVFGGMPASNGVRAAMLVNAGCSGVEDVFGTSSNVLHAFSAKADAGLLVDGLGERFEITRTNIKKYAVGSPAQAAVQAMVDLVRDHGLRADDVEDIEIVLPYELADVVNGREIPAINVQYLVAGTVLDGGFSFAMAHDPARMTSDAVTALLARTRLVPDPAVARDRVATLRVRTRSGATLAHTVTAVRGTVDDPMTTQDVVDKALDLLGDLGDARARELVGTLLEPARLADAAELHPLLTLDPG